jgi:hypothetical protein
MSLRRLSGLALVLLPLGIFGVTFAFARAQDPKATSARATPAARVTTRVERSVARTPRLPAVGTPRLPPRPRKRVVKPPPTPVTATTTPATPTTPATAPIVTTVPPVVTPTPIRTPAPARTPTPAPKAAPAPTFSSSG